MRSRSGNTPSLFPHPPFHTIYSPAPSKSMFSFFKKKTAVEPPPESTTPGAVPAEPQAPASERGWREKLGFGALSAAPTSPAGAAPAVAPVVQAAATTATQPASSGPPEPTPAERSTWLTKLRNGLRKTGSSIAQV